MARVLKLGVAVTLIFGLLWFLQSRVAEQPQRVVEQPVDLNAPQ